MFRHFQVHQLRLRGMPVRHPAGAAQAKCSPGALPKPALVARMAAQYNHEAVQQPASEGRVPLALKLAAQPGLPFGVQVLRQPQALAGLVQSLPGWLLPGG